MADQNVSVLNPDEKPGRLFIVSAPSGAGKTTLCRALLQHFRNMVYSVSTTTRKPRPGEKEGADYFFISKEQFLELIQQNQWAEWALVHDHYYGTNAQYLNHQLDMGKDVLLDIDVQGARQILNRYPDSISIFIMPPTFEVLKDRMMSRGTDDPDVIEKRLANAKNEMAQRDMYRHIIINDRFEDALAELISLVESYSA